MPRLDILEGIRVVDFGRAYSGPYGSQLLADLGAEIIKIEVPGVGDFSRGMNPILVPGQSYTIQALNRNKKSVTLNVNTEVGREAFYDLVRISDVVYGNLRYDALARMGAQYSKLSEINPRIILCNITGWGQTGPYSKYPSYDNNLLAVSGIASLCSADSEGRPTFAPIALADLSGGLFSVAGVLAALYRREKTGKGCEVKFSILDGCLSLLSVHFLAYFLSGKVPKPAGARHPIGGISGPFRTKDGLLVLAPCWPDIAKAINREDLFSDPRFGSTASRAENNLVLCDIIEQEMMKNDSQYWLSIMRKMDIPVSPLHAVDEALEDPQVRHNNVVIEMTHPIYGKTKGIESPIKIDGATESPHYAPPTLGQDTEEVLKNLLGYSDEKISRLKLEEDAAEDKIKKRIRHSF